jgi:hypothetical protein
MMEGAKLKGGEVPTSPSGSTTASNGTGLSARSIMAAGANGSGEKVGGEEENATTAVALSPVDGAVRRRVNLSSKREDTGTAENGSVRSAERSSRPASVTSAWGKVLVVPFPTLSHVPHSPQTWGIPEDVVKHPHQQTVLSGWGREGRRHVVLARHPFPPSLLVKCGILMRAETNAHPGMFKLCAVAGSSCEMGRVVLLVAVFVV